MVRGINRQDIFEDEEDYLQMVSILRALSDRHDEQGLRLPPLSIFYAYCLMSNHLIYWTTLGAVGRNMHLTAIRIHSVLPELFSHASQRKI